MADTPKYSRAGMILRAYLMATRLMSPYVRKHLEKRLMRGKENPERWREKLGHPSDERPGGRLVWMHGVGLGEVLALRGLIQEMHRMRPDTEYLVTSGTRASAEVFAQNMPPACRHQFLPIDSPKFVARFLDHWRPDLCIWAEQDLWPGFVWQAYRRGIPIAMVNARMNEKSYRSRRRVGSLFADLFKRFAKFAAQDRETACHLELLGARNVEVTGSLKPAAAALVDHTEKRHEFEAAIKGRNVWLVASSHGADEALAMAAHQKIRETDPSALLIIAPRYSERKSYILEACKIMDLTVSVRSDNQLPQAADAVYLADTLGEMGIWYRLCRAAFIGGSAGDVGGHNPWEAAQLNCAIFHGPNVANFKTDYATLHAAQGAAKIVTAEQLAAAIGSPEINMMAAGAIEAAALGVAPVRELCKTLVLLLETAKSPNEQQ